MQQSLDQALKPLVVALKQYGTTIIFVLLAVLVGAAIFRLSMIVSLSSQAGIDGYTPVSKANAIFDQKTINRVDNLRTPSESEADLKFPSRQSPFVE